MEINCILKRFHSKSQKRRLRDYMKHYTVKSKLPSNTIIPIIESNTSNYMLSKVVADDLMLCKIESNNYFQLFYTGKKLRGHSLYRIQVKIINDDNSCILQLQQKLRTDMKYMYYIPMVFWLIGILLLFKSIFLILFIEIMQIAISTIVLLIVKNVGKKKQVNEVIDFLQQTGII